MFHTKVPVPSLDDNPNANSAIDDDPCTKAYSYDHTECYQYSPYYQIGQSVRRSPTISSKQFMESTYHTRVPGTVTQYTDYESNSIAGRSEDSKGSKDSGFESARSFRILGYGGPHPGSPDVRYYPASVGRLQESSDIDLFSSYEPLQEHSDTGSASSVRAVSGKETQKTHK